MEMDVKLLILSVFLSFLIICNLSERVAGQCPVNLKLLCYEQTTCGDCMRAHACCHWCYDQKNFNGTHRCNLIEELEDQCGNNIERNKISKYEITKDKEFTKIEKAEDAPNAIQIKPQSFQVTLRQDTPINLTFTYKAAKNYPLELYYLGDLSYSMRTHLVTLQSLGDALGKSLANLTEHYRLAYGSFLDKPGMPFVYTDQKNFKNPCITDDKKCEQAYLFKHRLNFTKTTERFFEEVRNSKISANVDDLDGALDAIFQILVCNKRFGWSEYSRKIILLSTDSLLHTAGDGILVGATAVNDKELCLVNSTGDFTEPLKYDYPSLGQIKSLLRKYKVNLIVAVTKDKKESYQKMERDILDQEAFVGELEQDSKNILDLVNTGYSDFIRQVEFSADGNAPELEVKFFADCYGDGEYNDTSGCQNVEQEKPMTFKLQLTLKDFTSNTSTHFVIREKTINEQIDIDVNYVCGNCECAGYENTPRCDHGTVNCGDCICESGWKGETCSEECKNEPGACRSNETNARTCSGRGDCECGKCSCQSPYVGEFCEFECPTNRYGQICSGHGKCLKGLCNCNNEYEDVDCSCEKSTDKCKLIVSDSRLCSGHGHCQCNKCHCDKEYQGTYCERKGGQNDFCEAYESIVKEYNENKTKIFQKDNVDILVEETDRKLRCSDACTIVVFSGTQRCFVDYCYHSGANNTVRLETKNPSCIYTAQALGFGTAILIIFTILIAGLIIILIKKWQIHKAEMAEYKKFKEADSRWQEMNPIYKSPVSEFRNPMARQK